MAALDTGGGASRADLMTGGGYRLLASTNFGELVLGCINAELCLFLRYASATLRHKRKGARRARAVLVFSEKLRNVDEIAIP